MVDSLVSIIIPVYNAGLYLRQSVESIINQTYKKIEIVIVDDGSTDNCISTIRGIEDSRISIYQQQNQGKANALNKALKFISGEYFALQDADDLSYPTRIYELLKVMNNNMNVATVFSGYDLIINNKQMAPILKSKSIFQCREDITNMRMPSHDPTAFFRTSYVKDFKFNEELKIGQGWDHILRVGEQYPMIVINKCLYSYRVHNKSTTRSDNQLVNEKACRVIELAKERRKLKNWNKRNKSINNNGLSSHFMESVLDLRKHKRLVEAFNVSIFLLKLNHYKIVNYKPMAYFFTPLVIIRIYRKFKLRLERAD